MPESENEHEHDEETGSRFNKAIIGRILAVGLFVALGTFAVVQSIGGNGKHSPTTGTETLAAATEGIGGAADKFSSGVANKARDLKNAAGKTFNRASAVLKPKGTAFDRDKLSKFKPTVVKPNSSAFKPTPPSNPGGFKPNKTPVVVTKPKITPPPAKAPERFAQAPGGTPLIGNKSGFAARAQTKPPASPFSPKPAINSFGGAKEQFGATANKLKSNLGSAADDLLAKTSGAAQSAGNSLKSGFNNATSRVQSAIKPKSGFAPKPGFAPPAVKSDFGQPPTDSPFSQKSNSNSASSSRTKPPGRTFAPTTPKSNLVPVSRNFAAKAPTQGSGSTNSPFGAAKSSATPFNSKAAPPNRSFGGSNFNSTRQTSSTSPRKPASQFNNQRPNSPPKTSPFSNASSSNSRTNSRIGANLRSASGASGLSGLGTLSKNIPGERQLEGVQAPALTVEKLSPREIQVNQTADFQLIIKNVGRVAAEGVQVFDKTPSGTEFIGASPEPSSGRGGDLRWDIGTLRPGQEKRIKIQLKPIRHGEIGSVAHVTFNTMASMRTLVTKPVLEIVHEAKNVHLIGDEVLFDITVKNKGDGPANNVMLQEDVPQELEFQDGSQAIEYEIGTLLPGQSKRLRLALKAAKIGKTRNILFASADGGLECKHELPLEVVAPNLVAKSDGPTRRFLQRSVAHSFSVANNGTARATNVELIARLPSGLRFKNANNQGRYDANAHSVYWSLAELDRDARANVELKTTPVEIGTQPIKFETFADLEVQASVIQPLNVEHLVDVFIDIDDVIDPIEIGSDTSYRIRVVNQGTKAATNVQLGVMFPRGLQPTGVNGSIRHQISGQQIAFEPINSMSPGDEISFVVQGKGTSAGDHRVVINMKTDGRQTQVSKEETTRVYSDR